MEKRYSASENHLFFNPLPPKGTSSGRRWKNDFRQAKITFQAPTSPRHQPYRERWNNDYRFSASENHFFSPYPFQGTTSGRRGKTIFGKQTSAFPGRGLSNHQFADTSKRMTFSKQKSPFQILAPSNHQLWKNKHQTIFRIRNSHSKSISIPDNRFVQSKSKRIRPYVGHKYVNLIVCFFLIVLPENNNMKPDMVVGESPESLVNM